MSLHEWSAGAGALTQGVEAAAEVRQGRALVVAREGDHPTDDDGVVAGEDELVRHALDPGQRVLKARAASVAGVVGEGGKLVGLGRGEVFSERLLLGGEQVDNEGRMGGQWLYSPRPGPEADQDERRVGGDCGNSRRGQAELLAVRTDRRNDADPGGQAAEGLAEGGAIHGGRAERGGSRGGGHHARGQYRLFRLLVALSAYRSAAR